MATTTAQQWRVGDMVHYVATANGPCKAAIVQGATGVDGQLILQRPSGGAEVNAAFNKGPARDDGMPAVGALPAGTWHELHPIQL